MVQAWLAQILRCTNCGSAGLSEGAGGLLCPNGHHQPVEGNNLIYGSAEAKSGEWTRMQQGSLERYQHESYNQEELPILRLFGGFIAVDIDRDAVVLDIGCGLTARAPAYVDELGFSHYLGLEPLEAPVARDYPCLVGAIAESIPLADASVDVILFATSLDHIEEEDLAIAECRRILAPGGRIIFWQGLHEPKYLAASKTFEPIFGRGSLLKRAIRVAAGPVEYALIGYRMWDRARKLRTGARIDDMHCRYYTEAMMSDSLARWGLHETRRVIVPGTASMFVSAKPPASVNAGEKAASFETQSA